MNSLHSMIFHSSEVHLFNLSAAIINRVKWNKAKCSWIPTNKMMHLRLHVRYNVSRNSTFSVACNRIAVGESIVTGDLLSLELASESSSNTKNEIPPAIPVENEKSLHRHHPKFASGIDSCGKGSREHNFRNAFATPRRMYLP